MSLTPSNMLPLGTKAPNFTLFDTVSGNTLALADVVGKQATVVMFICNHCPYVVHIMDALVAFVGRYQDHDVSFVAISSNDVNNYPQDAPNLMRQLAAEKAFTFPYLYDESQDVAKAYDAACTPDFYVFDHAMCCVYRGRFDGATPGNGVAVTGNDLGSALDVVLSGGIISVDQKPSVGCNIKWKA